MSDIIDLKFKDMPPEETVKKIQSILQSLDIAVEENWSDSGIENCWSLCVNVKDGLPSSNGKGITRALAQASAYAEFIERLQQGLHYYKLNTDNPKLFLQTYAPDGKYMSMQELEENGDWMDYLTQSYGSSVTRKKIAKLCSALASSDDGKILTIPFYSLFEDKYVYLPAAFVNQMYTSNGCCAGNTKEEAFVHGISEIFERRNKDKLLLSGEAAPILTDDLVMSFPNVARILNKLRQDKRFDVTIFDISYGTGYPVVATRIIDKSTHSYIVNAASDPVLEIAIQRTLTETFQGRNISSFRSGHNGSILNKIDDFPIDTNLRNSHVSSSGIYTADFFCDSGITTKAADYSDNSTKSNKELLDFAIGHCRKLNRPVYIRNYSYLGFISYKVIIPGMSEGTWTQLLDPMPDMLLGTEVSKILRDSASASNEDLSLLLMFHKKVNNKIDIGNNFNRLSGIPLDFKHAYPLMRITLAHAAYRLGKLTDAIEYCAPLLNIVDIEPETKEYLECVQMYIKLTLQGILQEKIRMILTKLHYQKHVKKLYGLLDCGKSPYEDDLVHCDYLRCDQCKHAPICTYSREVDLIHKVGKRYCQFTDGQNREFFPFISR